jgi:hypothetical protein
MNQKTGLTQLINIKRSTTRDDFSKKRNPILWNINNQITGDSIHLISNQKTESIDSLKVFQNAFMVSKDTIGEGFNQISGKRLIGLFEDNNFKTVDIIKNAETIYYLRNEESELVGIDKSQSAAIKIWFENSEITEIRKMNQIDGTTYPEEDFPEIDKLLKGFVWREDERPLSVEDIFSDDPPLVLPKIKGLEAYQVPETFFDTSKKEANIQTKKPLKRK